MAAGTARHDTESPLATVALRADQLTLCDLRPIYLIIRLRRVIIRLRRGATDFGGVATTKRLSSSATSYVRSFASMNLFANSDRSVFQANASAASWSSIQASRRRVVLTVPSLRTFFGPVFLTAVRRVGAVRLVLCVAVGTEAGSIVVSHRSGLPVSSRSFQDPSGLSSRRGLSCIGRPHYRHASHPHVRTVELADRAEWTDQRTEADRNACTVRANRSGNLSIHTVLPHVPPNRRPTVHTDRRSLTAHSGPGDVDGQRAGG